MESDTEDSGFLSEVHVGSTIIPTEDNEENREKRFITRFHFKSKDISSPVLEDEEKFIESTFDKDGDLNVLRRKKSKRNHNEYPVITIVHALETPLDTVGLQVWRGSLLLADFLVDHEEQFHNCYAMEIGSGTGLAGIAIARVAKRVYITDYSEVVLKNCERNVQLNMSLFRNSSVVKVRKFDWNNLEHFNPFDPRYNHKEDHLSRFLWNEEDFVELNRISVILAADGWCLSPNSLSAFMILLATVNGHFPPMNS